MTLELKLRTIYDLKALNSFQDICGGHGHGSTIIYHNNLLKRSHFTSDKGIPVQYFPSECSSDKLAKPKSVLEDSGSLFCH